MEEEERPQLYLKGSAKFIQYYSLVGLCLVFIGATADKYFRAFNSETGEEVWRYRTPYTGNSSPLSYRLQKNGKQYVVIAAGGHGWSKPGDAIMAFALPD